MEFYKFHSILFLKYILLEDNVIMHYFLPIMILHINTEFGEEKTFFEAKNFQVPIHFKTSARR